MYKSRNDDVVMKHRFRKLSLFYIITATIIYTESSKMSIVQLKTIRIFNFNKIFKHF